MGRVSENILHLYSVSLLVRKICRWLSTSDLQIQGGLNILRVKVKFTLQQATKAQSGSRL